MDRVLLIIPIFNGEKHLKGTLLQLEELVHQMRGILTILFVNDGSEDRTKELLSTYTGSLKNTLRVLTFEKNYGKGYSIREGIRQYAKSVDYICFTDADLPYGISAIHEVIEQCVHTDVVVGSRSMAHEQKQYSGYRYITNRLFRRCIPASIRDIKDTQCGLKAFRAKVAEDIFNSITTFRWTFDLEIFLIARKRRYQIQEIGVTIRRAVLVSAGGVSFLKDGCQILKDIIRIRKNLRDGVYEQ